MVEAFEQFVAVFLEEQQPHYVVSPAVKIPYARQTKKRDRVEIQEHGYEVDLLGAREDSLLLASVKSFFGSNGVPAEHVMGEAEPRFNKRYALFNEPDLRRAIVHKAAKRYGYSVRQVQLALFVGRFAAPTRGENERRIREWCRKQRVGAGPIQVFSLQDMVPTVLDAAVKGRQYRDNPVLVTMKLLKAARLLNGQASQLAETQP